MKRIIISSGFFLLLMLISSLIISIFVENYYSKVLTAPFLYPIISFFIIQIVIFILTSIIYNYRNLHFYLFIISFFVVIVLILIIYILINRYIENISLIIFYQETFILYWAYFLGGFFSSDFSRI
jgi:O-antigen/teichoic acid export membrane protein